MVSKLANDKSPDFSTLSGIMDYFNRVPFETFKKEISEWFIRELPNKRPDLINTNGNIDIPLEFHDLMDNILNVVEEMDQSRLN